MKERLHVTEVRYKNELFISKIPTGMRVGVPRDVVRPVYFFLISDGFKRGA